MTPLRIGLTGGIASGKTTAAERFSEWGVPVIDADAVARTVVVPGSDGLAQVVARFGAGIQTPDGQLDRRALRNRIFADPAAREDLEGILHPLIRAETERRAAVVRTPYLVMAVPLLAKGGGLERFDRILVVDVDEEVQLSRVMARDGSSRDEARAILAAQSSRAERLKIADDVLINAGTVAELRNAVDALHARYLQLSATPAP